MKNILICIDWFLPAFKAGGPIQSISNIVTHLKYDFNFWIYTSNRDLNEILDIPSDNLNTWIKWNDINIMYADNSHQNIKTLNKLFKMCHFDIIYLNSLFSFNFSLLPLIIAKKNKIKIVIAPRGMLGSGALAIKPIKKILFLKIFKILKLHKNMTWHATCESELDEIKFIIGDHTKVLVAPNLSKKIFNSIQTKNKQNGHIKLFFLSRISIKKNLLGAIKILELLPIKVAIDFAIIGPIDDNSYWKKCQSKLNDLPNNIKITYHGSIPNHELNKILKEQHILILPTHHENFGHVILESWQNGCPVLISKNTPWRDLESKYLGFDLDKNLESYSEVIFRFAQMGQAEFNKWSKASYEFGKEFSENKDLINKTKELFS